LPQSHRALIAASARCWRIGFTRWPSRRPVRMSPSA